MGGGSTRSPRRGCTSALRAARAPPGWVAAYVGLPCPHPELGCWLFARRVLAERFCVWLPSFRTELEDRADAKRAVAYVLERERAAWRLVLSPEALAAGYRDEAAGDVALLRGGRYRAHVGVIVALRTFLHAEPGCTTRLSQVDSVEYRSRFLGCYRHPVLEAREARPSSTS